jgi:hypothetical protein
LNSEHGTKPVLISLNGRALSIDSTYTSIPTHYPYFDTLTFIHGSGNPLNPILCNFKPGNSYSIIGACCGSSDIVLSGKLKTKKYLSLIRQLDSNYEENYSKIQSILMDMPSFTLRIVNGSKQDSIYGWYMDYSCIPRFKMLDTKGWNYGPAQKCYYWSNISTFVFFTSHEDFKKDMNKEGEIEIVYPENMKVLSSIDVRLFDNKKYCLTYDKKKNSIQLEYLK